MPVEKEEICDVVDSSGFDGFLEYLAGLRSGLKKGGKKNRKGRE